jgi:hypothetical protein
MLKRSLFAFALCAFAQAASAQFTTPVDVTVDTGSHTCTSTGQEKKVYKEIYAGDSRYFVGESLSTVSTFGKGECAYSPDHGENYVTKNFCVTDADGQKECSQRLVKVVVRAFADCTNNPLKLGTRIAAECRFTATSKRGNPQ